MKDTYTIAVDFDGTIGEDAYPDIGKPQLFAFDTLKKLQDKEYPNIYYSSKGLILWTYRYGKALDEAVAFCKENGITFYAVNKSFPEEDFDIKYSRKINADLFIDDRNVGGLMGWGEIYQELVGENAPLPKKKKKGWFGL